jgi:hypothetical protein
MEQLAGKTLALLYEILYVMYVLAVYVILIPAVPTGKGRCQLPNSVVWEIQRQG